MGEGKPATDAGKNNATTGKKQVKYWNPYGSKESKKGSKNGKKGKGKKGKERQFKGRSAT